MVREYFLKMTEKFKSRNCANFFLQSALLEIKQIQCIFFSQRNQSTFNANYVNYLKIVCSFDNNEKYSYLKSSIRKKERKCINKLNEFLIYLFVQYNE